jgi:dihydroflavonol-4-reductase
MKTLVTGGTGLLGGNLVRLLSAQGHDVRALVRSPEKARKYLGDLPGVQIIAGDMEDVNAFAPALDGVDVLFHTAAYFREYYGPGDHWGQLERINVRATIQLLEEADRRGVKKAIHVSSSGAIGANPGGGPSDETTGPDDHARANLYYRSKIVGEEAIAAFLKTHKLPVVLVNPTGIFGPGDTGPTGFGQMIINFANGALPASPPGAVSMVDARDAAQAMINAVEKGRSGERYILDAGHMTLDEMFAILSQRIGRPAPRKIPYRAALIYAHFTELVARITGNPPTAPVEGIRTLNRTPRYSSEKARRELGASFRPMQETLQDAVAWFRQDGSIRADRVSVVEAARQKS